MFGSFNKLGQSLCLSYEIGEDGIQLGFGPLQVIYVFSRLNCSLKLIKIEF